MAVGTSARVALMLLMLTAGLPEDSSATPQVSKGIGLSVFVSRDPAGKPELRAVVSNNTARSVAVWDDCSRQNGMFAIFRSKSVMELLHKDPTKRAVSCPETLLALPPDGFLETHFPISDTLYTWEGAPAPMLPGTYYLNVTFEWREDVVARRHVLQHAISFDWPVPTDSKPVGGLAPKQNGGTLRLPTSKDGTGAISGTVLDSLTSKPLPFAAVRIVESDRTLPVETDNILLWHGAKVINARSHGNFMFDNLSVGCYDVRASFTCYKRGTARVMVTQGDTVHVKLLLKRSEENANCTW